MKKYKFKQKVQTVTPEPISYKYGSNSLDSNYPVCTWAGCNRKAICSKTEGGHSLPNELCATHWVIWDRQRAGLDIIDSNGNTVIKKRIRKGSVTNAVLDLIESKKKHDPTVKEMKNVVLGVKPDSKFNQNHYNWYMNQYKKGKLRRKV